MVDVVTQIDPGARTQARMNKLRKAMTVPVVRVVPAGGVGFTEEEMRQLLKHPKVGGFRPDGDIEWPDDVFTQRRLREGSIKLSAEAKPAEETKPEARQVEQQAAGQSKGGGQ